MIFHSKTQPPPECLAVEKNKAYGTYNCDGVLEQLRRDFKNKCYICETKEPHTINIEHFAPHRGDKDLKFCWDNLFYCCGHCNNTKLSQPKYDLILNCTKEEDMVDTKIKYKINPWPKEKADIKAIEETDKVNNTVELLQSVYNGTTELKTIESANIRKELLKEIRKFQDLLFEFYDDNYTAEEKARLKNSIIRQLRPTSPFTAFKLWVLRDNEDLSEEFARYI